MLECQQYSRSVVINAALITWLFIASIGSLAQAKDLVTLERDFNSTFSAIKSWEGVIRIEIEGGDSPYTANGTFAWDANRERFRCSIEFPTNLNLLGEKNTILESTTVKRLREVIVKDGARLEIWHGGGNSSIPGFEIAERDRKRSFSIGYRRELDPLSLMVPQLEFCPEFLYRGHVPSMREVLRLTVEHADEPGVDALHGIGEDGRYFIRSVNGQTAMFFSNFEGVWLPAEISSPIMETKWKWALKNGQIIPTSLVSSDIASGIVSSYAVSENKLNSPIDETLFDSSSLKANEGDYLVDSVSNKLLRFNGTSFVDPDNESSNFVWSRFFTLLLLFACLVVCFFFLMKRRGNSN